MYIKDSALEDLFRKVRQTQEEIRSYCLGGDKPVASVDDLLFSVKNMYGIDVILYLVPHETIHLDSFLLRYKDRCEILISDSLAESERRFASVKEISHIIIDQSEDWSTDVLNTIDTLLRDSELEISTDGEHTPEHSLVGEHISVVAASEFLYPDFFVDADKKLIETNSTTVAAISVQRKIPVRCVKLLHNESNYTMFKQFRARVSATSIVSSAPLA
ncbi:hypothetical protein ACMAUO_06240 [Gluconacetobacter sp. Hr-1-5]|uniref:hypothetical protein n=1 Tax=Gluconacetobacter sp. Hr-1-5 TaxID=3395370 RepID=UPI003B53037A